MNGKSSKSCQISLKAEKELYGVISGLMNGKPDQDQKVKTEVDQKQIPIIV